MGTIKKSTAEKTWSAKRIVALVLAGLMLLSFGAAILMSAF